MHLSSQVFSLAVVLASPRRKQLVMPTVNVTVHLRGLHPMEVFEIAFEVQLRLQFHLFLIEFV